MALVSAADAEQDPGGRGRAMRRAATGACAVRVRNTTHADGNHDAAGDQPACRPGASSFPPEGSISAEEGDQTARHERRAHDLAAPHPLAGQACAERQREHHADDLDRLHHDQAPEAEGGGLHAEPGQHDGDAGKPQRLLREPGQEAGSELRVGGLLMPPFCWSTVPSAYRNGAPSASRTAVIVPHPIPLALRCRFRYFARRPGSAAPED